MNTLTARCGCHCTQCPAYKENIRTADQRERNSAGWAKYPGIKPNAGQEHSFDG